MSASAMHKGYLILVNYQNAYTFETDFKIQPFYGNKNSSYKLRDTVVSLDSYAMEQCNAMMAAFDAETGNHDILINSAYRTKEDQEAIYNSYIEEYGQEYADDYVALPGYSEHHTGTRDRLHDLSGQRAGAHLRRADLLSGMAQHERPQIRLRTALQGGQGRHHENQLRELALQICRQATRLLHGDEQPLPRGIAWTPCRSFPV